jgi:hypothetical protein
MPRDEQGDKGPQDRHDSHPWHVGEVRDHVAADKYEQPRQGQVLKRRIAAVVEANRAVLRNVAQTGDPGAKEHSDHGEHSHENPGELDEELSVPARRARWFGQGAGRWRDRGWSKTLPLPLGIGCQARGLERSDLGRNALVSRWAPKALIVGVFGARVWRQNLALSMQRGRSQATTNGLGTRSPKLVLKLVPDLAEMTPAQGPHWQRIWLI